MLADLAFRTLAPAQTQRDITGKGVPGRAALSHELSLEMLEIYNINDLWSDFGPLVIPPPLG
jgi:hypothetical protein